MKITEFFNTDYVDQASYDNLRKIASLMDGQKNASRKILYTILEKNIKDKIKVSQLSSKMAEFAEYLHGSAEGVIVNLAQDFPGTNNIPLLQKKGNFGTRFSQEASASRYIYTYGSNVFNLFKREDNDVLINQSFEGQKIEPMFYVPNLPILLINGSEGVSSGFAQKILPRNPECIKQYIKEYIKEPLGNVRPSQKTSLIPYYRGFKGEIYAGERSSQWLIKGVLKRINSTKFEITEIPIGYSLKGYINVLDELEEKRIISSYTDLSEDDNFYFEVKMPSKTLASLTDEQLLSKMKLIKVVSENYTVIDENNKIVVFENAKQILDKYIEVKLEFTEKRKNHMVSKLNDELSVLKSKYFFIKSVIDGDLILNNKQKSAIIEELDAIDNIIKKNDSYEYLVNMPIHSLTMETFAKLKDEAKNKKKILDELLPKTASDIFLEDLERL